MTYRTNIVAGSALALFAAVYFYFSFDIKPFSGLGATPLDSTFIPRLWGACLFLLSLSLVVRGFRERKRNSYADGRTDTDKGSFAAAWRDNYEVILTFLSIFIYTALLGRIGFLIMSALYIFFQTVILSPPKKRNYKVAAVIAVVASTAIDFLFVELLSVLLPKGILGF